MNKTLPLTISKPPAMKFPQGGHTDGIKKGSHAGHGIAPKPSGGAPIQGNDRPSMGTMNGLARVQGVGTGPALGRLPIQNPASNRVSTKVGQTLPNTSAASTKKPNRKGGAAFYGEM